jgi:uncharacterized protein YoxC
MDYEAVALVALAFFLICAAIVVAWVGARAAALLGTATATLRAVEAEAIPTLRKVNGLLDQAGGSLARVDTILETTADGVQSADRTVRKVADVVARPAGMAAGASAYVTGAASSFRARRRDRDDAAGS